MVTRKLTVAGIFFSLAIVSATIWSLARVNYYTASDVFWYGVIAGFLSCLLLTFLALIGFLFFTLRAK